MNKLLDRAAIIFRLAAYDFKAAYAGSVFGSLWAVAEPLVTVAVYWFVYTFAFGGEDVGGVPYYLWLSVGMASWFFVAKGLTSVTSVFQDYSYLLKKMCFDKRILPIVRAVSSLWTHLVFIVVVLILASLNGIFVNLIQLLSVVGITAVFVFSLGRILSLLCGKFKDIKNIIEVILNVGFWLTPVFWNKDILNEEIENFVLLNPASVIIEAYRAAIIPDCTIEIEWIIYLIAVCFVFMIIGSIVEKYLLPDITDGL